MAKGDKTDKSERREPVTEVSAISVEDDFVRITTNENMVDVAAKAAAEPVPEKIETKVVKEMKPVEVLIRCIYERPNGVVHTIGDSSYNFQPDANRQNAHLCVVTNSEHIERFLSSPPDFELYNPDVEIDRNKPATQPAPPPDKRALGDFPPASIPPLIMFMDHFSDDKGREKRELAKDWIFRSYGVNIPMANDSPLRTLWYSLKESFAKNGSSPIMR